MLSGDAIRVIEDNVQQILDPLGFVLIELKGVNTGEELVLRFLIDRDEGGITISECAQLNRDISQLLIEKNIIDKEFSLEVSSPGLDRPLTSPKDFKRVLEKEIHVFLNEQHNGKVEFEGRLVKLDDSGVYISNDKNVELLIPFTKINRAKQVIL